MGIASVALKKGRGQGGSEGASPQWAVTEEPTPPPAFFQCNPAGRKGLGRLAALLTKAKTAAGIGALFAPCNTAQSLAAEAIPI